MGNTGIQLLTALTGSLGFALVFRLRARLLPWAALGGLLCFGSYMLLLRLMGLGFFTYLLASAAAELYAEILARLLRAPSTLFSIPAVIPLVPGRILFYAMSAVVRNDWAKASSYWTVAGMEMLAIATGMTLVWALVFMLREVSRRMAARKNGR